MSDFENYLNEDILLPNVNGAAYFILLYEWFEDRVISTVKDIYSVPCMLDGKEYRDIDDKYIKALKKKIDNGIDNGVIPYSHLLREAERKRTQYQQEVIDPIKGKDAQVLRGSLLWLQGQEAITDEDSTRISQIRSRRNVIVHELLSILGEGLSEEDAKMISELLELNQKINRWYFLYVDAPIMGYNVPDDTSELNIFGGDDVILQGMFRILFMNEGEQYKKILEQAKDDKTPVDV